MRRFAYLAGIVDGEGSITAVRNNTGRTCLLRLTVYNNDARLIRWIHRKFGGHVYISAGRNKKRHAKKSYQLVWRGLEMSFILERCLPYLISKKNQAVLALQFLHFQGTRPVSHRRYSDQELNYSLRTEHKMKSLNKRGPK